MTQFFHMNAVQLVMLALAIAGLTILLLSTRKKLHASMQPPKETIRDRYEAILDRPRASTNIHRDMKEVMIELDHLSRQIHARIDTKFAKLETVIRDADRRIADLQRLLEQPAGNRPTTADSDVNPEAPELPRSPTQPIRPSRRTQTEHICQLARLGMDPKQIACETDIPIGEVELVLSLHQHTQAP